MALRQKKTLLPFTCLVHKGVSGLSASNKCKPACMTGSIESASTYNRKQRNLACSLFPELTGGEGKQRLGGGLRNGNVREKKCEG